MIDILTSLRFFIILLIYFHHLSYPGGLGPPAVTFFFILSGFVIAYRYGKSFSSLDLNKLKEFYIKRISRVYPLHILTLILSLVIMYVTNFKTNWLSALLNIFLLQSYFPIGIQVFAFNSLAWFLSDIVFFYFLTPFLLFGLYKIRARENKYVLLIIAVFTFLCEILIAYLFNSKMEAYTIGWWFVYISPWLRVFDFTIGLLGGLIFYTVKSDNRSSIGMILFTILEIVALLCFVGSIYYSRFIPYPFLVMGVFFVPVSIILIFIFSFQKGGVSWLLSRNIFVFLGELGFTIFMLHQIMISYTGVFFMPSIYNFTGGRRHLVSQLILLINVIITSIVIFKYFEEPIRRKILAKLLPEN